MHYVYVIAERQTQKTYIGFTNDPKKRLARHRSGQGAKYTKTGKWELVYYEAFSSKGDALKREKRLKHDGRARYQLMKRIASSLFGQE